MRRRSVGHDGWTSWSAVALGWGVASLAGIVISPALRLAYGLFAEPPVGQGGLTGTLVVVSLVAGFLAYVIGGYVAARTAGHAGGKHGMFTALFGLVVGLVLAAIFSGFGILFAEGVAMPPVSFGFAGAALVAGLLLFLTNLFGGYVGGKLGEPSGLNAPASRSR